MGDLDATTADEQQYRAPELLTSDHDISDFDCGEASLNDWLTRRALRNQQSGATRTYVACQGMKVIAFYSLCTSSIAHAKASGKLRRNMPDPIPVMLLGRLAVDTRHHKQGIGKGLLKDALLRTLQAADIAGIRAIKVSVLNERAREFYKRFGFHPSPIDDDLLFITLGEVRHNPVTST